jgi:hypothetical protein
MKKSSADDPKTENNFPKKYIYQKNRTGKALKTLF